MSLADLLFAGEDRADDDALVHAGDRTWTRAEVRRRAEHLVGALVEAGVGPGRPVAVMLPDGAELVAALFGVWRAGAVYMPLNPRLTDGEVEQVLAAVPPAAVVTDEANAGRFGDRSVVVVAGDGWAPRLGRTPAAAGYDGDTALIQFTSGTTGRPKPVLLLHSGVLSLLDGVLRKIRPAGGSSGSDPPKAAVSSEPPKAAMPNLVPVSLSLWAGIYQILFAMRVGAPVVVMGRFEPVAFAGLVRRFDIRSTVLPPAAMTMLADDERVADLTPLKYVRSITAPLSPVQARRFKDRFGIAVLNSYGQTEIGGEIVGWSAADSREHGEAKLGSVGRPHDGVEVRVVDDEGAEVAGDLSGELLVRTPALSAGYADGGDLSDRLTPDGWFRTGDVGRVDADGFVWIEGRVSDMVNRGGLKVWPAEVEEVLRLSPAVADAAVVGVADDRLGQVPWAFVVPAAGAGVDGDALAAHCREHLAPYKVPVRFEPVESLPRNEVGKVLSHELVARATPS